MVAATKLPRGGHDAARSRHRECPAPRSAGDVAPATLSPGRRRSADTRSTPQAVSSAINDSPEQSCPQFLPRLMRWSLSPPTVTTMGRSAILVVIAALSLLAACSAEQSRPAHSMTAAASSSPSTAPPSAATASELATQPPRPAIVDERSAAGAEAFVQYWFDTAEFAVHSGDAAGLAAISDPECGSCTDLVGSVRKVASDGRRVTGGHFKVTNLVAPDIPPNGIVTVAMDLEQSSAEVTGGQATESIPPVESHLRGAVIRYRDEHWLLFGFGHF